MENNPQVPEQESVVEKDKVDNPQEQMISVSEMKRRLSNLEEKHAKQTEDAVNKALEKYKAEKELSGKELEDYRKKEAADEKKKLEDKIAELEKEKNKRELTEEAIKSLSTRKLPVNEKVLSFVVKDTADETLKAISDLESIISDIKTEYAQSEPPKTSSAFGGGETTRASRFRQARIIK